MAQNSFRILLDFRGANFKLNEFIWMVVWPRGYRNKSGTIKDLRDEILKKFSLGRTDLKLFLGEGILPEDEYVDRILKENDTVRLVYPEASNENNVRTRHFEVDASSSDDLATSYKKHKTLSNACFNLEENEQVKFNTKRTHSFSNGTCLLENNNTPENLAILDNSPVDRENANNASLNNFESIILSPNYKLSKNKKKLKYATDIALNSLTSEIESKVNSCKKKKKHKHSKDVCVSKDESMLHNEIVRINEREKKKKRKHSHKAAAVSFIDESNCIVKESNKSQLKKGFESLNIEQSKLKDFEKKEKVLFTNTEVSEVLHEDPLSNCTSSVIGSLESPKDNNQSISPKKSCDKPSSSDGKLVSELQKNNLSGQGNNNCKKRKRKRHRKRKSVDPQVVISNDWNSDVSQKIENIDPTFSASSHQSAEISSRSLETPDSPKSNAYFSTKKVSLSDLKRDLLEQFNSHHLSSSTPFSQPIALSGLQNVIFKTPSTSVVSQDLYCTVAESWNTNQKKMILTKMSHLSMQTENSLPTHSVPCEGTKNKNAAAISSTRLDENHLPSNHSFKKSTDTFTNEETKDHVQNPNFSYEDCPLLNSCPLVGTRIAYKVLELNANYCPEVSNYKEGIVKAVNPQTDELDIEFIEPEVKEGRSGKFENLYDDELPQSEVVRKVTLSWSSLINPVQVTYE